MRIKIYNPFLQAAKRTLYILSFISMPCITAAQDFFDNDARFWLYLKLDTKVTRRFEAQLIIQNRFNNNVTEYSQLNANGELSYKLNNHFKAIGGYVIGNTRKPIGIYITRQQAYAGFIAKLEFRKFRFFYRNLLQAQTRAIYNREKANQLQYFDRNKLTIKYELNKYLIFYVAEEINIPVQTHRANYDLTYINRSRTFAGVEIHYSRRSYIEPYFLFQRKYTFTGWPARDFIYGLTFSYSF